MEDKYKPYEVLFCEEDRQRYKKVFAKKSKLSANQLVMELMEDEKWKDDPRVECLLPKVLLNYASVPVNKRGQICVFDQVWIGIDLLKQHSEWTAMSCYALVGKDSPRYEKACELLGVSADEPPPKWCQDTYILKEKEKEPQPPDLLVFDSKNPPFPFFFCEAKKEDYPLNLSQQSLFPKIEECLNKHKPPCGSALRLPEGRWIQVRQLVDERKKG